MTKTKQSVLKVGLDKKYDASSETNLVSWLSETYKPKKFAEFSKYTSPSLPIKTAKQIEAMLPYIVIPDEDSQCTYDNNDTSKVVNLVKLSTDCFFLCKIDVSPKSQAPLTLVNPLSTFVVISENDLLSPLGSMSGRDLISRIHQYTSADLSVSAEWTPQTHLLLQRLMLTMYIYSASHKHHIKQSIRALAKAALDAHYLTPHIHTPTIESFLLSIDTQLDAVIMAIELAVKTTRSPSLPWLFSLVGAALEPSTTPAFSRVLQD